MAELTVKRHVIIRIRTKIFYSLNKCVCFGVENVAAALYCTITSAVHGGNLYSPSTTIEVYISHEMPNVIMVCAIRNSHSHRVPLQKRKFLSN